MAEQCNSGYSSDFQTPLSVNGTGFFSWVDHFCESLQIGNVANGG